MVHIRHDTSSGAVRTLTGGLHVSRDSHRRTLQTKALSVTWVIRYVPRPCATHRRRGRPRRYPRRLSQLPGHLPSPSPFQLPALVRTASGQRANVLPQSDLARALPRELPRIMPPPLSRRRAVALLADPPPRPVNCPNEWAHWYAASTEAEEPWHRRRHRHRATP